MTEAEWLRETSRAQWMASLLGDRGLARTKAGRRKLRLFACACCRVAWDILPEDRLRDAVQVAERFADGAATKDEMAAARTVVAPLTDDSGPFGEGRPSVRVAIDMAVAATDPQAYSVAFSMTSTEAPLGGRMKAKAAESCLCEMLRDIFGNPFRPVTFSPSWRTGTAVSLTRQMYDARDFGAMPILADVLQDAGCDNDDILNHCRGDGPHVRGCWVVDLVLGKE